MSDRSLSPNRIPEINARGEFRETEAFKENTDDEGRDYDAECDLDMEPALNVTASATSLPAECETPKKTLSRENSPHGSPKLKQRLLTNIPAKKNAESFFQENITLTYLVKKGDGSSTGSKYQKTETLPEDDKYRQGVENVTNQQFHEEAADNFGSYMIWILVSIGIFCFVICTAIGWDAQESVNNEADLTSVRFSVNWSELKNKFPGQTPKFWQTVGAATRSLILPEEPRDPAVILMVVPESEATTGKCFALQYAKAVAAMFELQSPSAVSFDCHGHASRNPEEVKLKIDEELEDGFRAGRKVAVIEHLEDLAPEAAMMFYKFCENDHAPYKRVAILFTFHVDDREYARGDENDEFAEEKLRWLWGSVLGSHRFQPLMSRIANSVVFLRPESQVVVDNCLA